MENKSYIVINGGQPINLTEEQVKELKKSLNNNVCPKNVAPGETFVHCGVEFIVLEHTAEGTLVITKELWEENVKFGRNNNFADEDCNVRKSLERFANKIGTEQMVEHIVDLTSDDGLKDYGTTRAYVSLLTTEQCRKYVDILDKHKVNKWWWLVTPFSTPTHEDDEWVKCVSPRGNIGNDDSGNGNHGVRPVCILKSDIFVS